MIEVFYFFYFQAVAIYMAFMPPYLRSLGMSGGEISALFAIPPVLALGVPLAWAWLADRTRRHDRVLRLVIGGAWLGFTPLLFAHRMGEHRFAFTFAGWASYAIFGVGVGGLADALAVARVRAGAVYGRMRFWGSFGFVVAATVVGLILRARGARPLDPSIPLAMWAALGCAFAASWSLRGTGEPGARPRAADVAALLADPRLRVLLVLAATHWVCLAPYNVYFGVFLRELGLSPVYWGLGYSTGVVTEMVVLLVFHRLQTRFRLATLLSAVFVASAIRWLGVALIPSTAALIALQTLHGLTFGMFWSASLALITATVPPPVRATGQALFLMSLNLGGAIGNLVTGHLYDASGARALFLLAAAGELIPLAITLKNRVLRS